MQAKSTSSASRLTEVSKFLSFVLRHKPQAIGLVLDAQGWAATGELLEKAGVGGTVISRDELLAAVATSDKKRFTLSEDGNRIRAAQGHSVSVELGLAPVQPPEQLFHGTATRSLDSIWSEGLRPGERQKVHLSTDGKTARSVGSRHGKPAILKVASGQMHRDGLLFWQAENGVWLTDAVPVRYLTASD